MAVNQIDIGCDLNQGFNFRKDVMKQIGMVTKLKIGDVNLTEDMTLKDPENNQKDLKVVGVVNFIGWSVSPSDPVQVSLQVSEDAKNKLDVLTKKNLSNVEVEFEFDCYNYDPGEKKYFKNFHSNDKTMEGLIFGQGDDLAIRIGLQPNTQVQEPRNFPLSLGIKPQPKEQSLHYASSVQDKVVMQYGIAKV
jgi:hypothetical protein